MAKKRLKIKDKQGNVVDYDISAASVTIDVEGKSLEVKLSELVDAISRSVKSVTFNGNSPTMDSNGNVNLGQQVQPDWKEGNINWPSFIRNKPSFSRVATTGSYNDLTDKPTIPEGVATDSQMSDSSDAPVKNRVIKAYVDNLISGLVNGAPQALDTLKELSAALGNDANFAATITQQLAGKISGIKKHDGQALTPDSNGIVTLPESEAGTQGPKGDTGNVEITDAGDLVTILVNDLTTGGAGNILSAEMGKRLALMSGTFAQAWARSKAIPFPFCFLWNETINGDAISKPIWHKGNSVFIDAAGAIVNVEAAAVPNAPTITGATSGSTVPKNTQITITPASGSALYYSLDGGTTYNVSDAAVTIKLETAGSVSIVAYCANNKGNSDNATLSVTVAGTAVPTFAAKPNSGTTLTQKSGYIEVSRGGYVRISGTENGTLYYSTDGENYTEVQGNNYYDFQIADDDYETTAFVIYAKNKVGNDFSDPVTGTFKMAALTSPSFSVATGTEFPATGGSVGLTGPAGVPIYYTMTTDGTTPADPTEQSTLYSGAIAVNAAMTIKAIAHDNYGDSAVAEASYTVAVDHKFQFKIKLTGNNSTEYVPVAAATRYSMSVDWGDGSAEQSFDNSLIGAKNCSHQYTGSAGDEKTITIRGSKIPVLGFCSGDLCNIAALVEVVENTLECETQFRNSSSTTGGFSDCSGLAQISADALSNNTYGHVSFKSTALTSLPDGLLNHLTKSGVALSSCSQMFHSMSNIVVSSSQMAELKSSISQVTAFNTMFYGAGSGITIPNGFFSGVADGTVTTVKNMTLNSNVGGDAGDIVSTLENKVTASITSTNKEGCVAGSQLTNVNSVDLTGWT